MVAISTGEHGQTSLTERFRTGFGDEERDSFTVLTMPYEGRTLYSLVVKDDHCNKAHIGFLDRDDMERVLELVRLALDAS